MSVQTNRLLATAKDLLPLDLLHSTKASSVASMSTSLSLKHAFGSFLCLDNTETVSATIKSKPAAAADWFIFFATKDHSMTTHSGDPLHNFPQNSALLADNTIPVAPSDSKYIIATSFKDSFAASMAWQMCSALLVLEFLDM